MARAIVVNIVGDADRFRNSVRSASAEADSFGKKLGRVSAVAGAAIAGALALVAQAGVKIASDTAEASSKVSTLFGQSSASVEAFAATSAKSYGIATRDALAYAGSVGAVLRAQGLNEKSAADLSLTYTKLAADLGSFNNTSSEEALMALTAAQTGEFEQLKKFGIVINDVRLAQEAQRLGIEKTGATWDTSTKRMLAHNIILSDTAQAQGDFERTQGGAANQAKIFQASLTDLQGTLGAQLLPLFVTALQRLNQFTTWCKENPAIVKAVAVGLGVLAGAFGLVTLAMWALSATPVMLIITGIALAVAGLAAGLMYAWQTSETFREIVVGVFNTIKDGVATAVKAIVGILFGWWDFALAGMQKVAEMAAIVPDWLGGGFANNAAQAIAGLRAGLTNLKNDIYAVADAAMAADWALGNVFNGTGTGPSTLTGNEMLDALSKQNDAYKARTATSSTAPAPSAFVPAFDAAAIRASAGPVAISAAKSAGGSVGKAMTDGVGDALTKGEQKIKDQITRMWQKVKDRQAESKAIAKAIRETFSMIFSDYEKAEATDTPGVRNALGVKTPSTRDNFIKSLEDQADAAEKFVRRIKMLRKAGLRESLVQQFIEQGPGSLADLEQITRGNVDAVNKLAGRSSRAGKELGVGEAKRQTGLDPYDGISKRDIRVTLNIDGQKLTEQVYKGLLEKQRRSGRLGLA